MKRDRFLNWGRLALPMLLVVALGLGCDDDEGTGPDIGPLVGTWIASADNAGTSLTLTPAAPANPIPVVPDLGGTVTAEVTAAERLIFTVNVPALGINGLVEAGDIELLSSTRARYISDDDEPGDPPLEITYGLSNNNTRLTVSAPGAELLDLNDDGIVDAADAVLLVGVFDQQ